MAARKKPLIDLAVPKKQLWNNAHIQEEYLSARQYSGTAPFDKLKNKLVTRGIKHNAGKAVGRAISKGILKGVVKRGLSALVPGMGIAMAASDANAAIKHVAKKQQTQTPGPIRKRTSKDKAKKTGGRR